MHNLLLVHKSLKGVKTAHQNCSKLSIPEMKQVYIKHSEQRQNRSVSTMVLKCHSIADSCVKRNNPVLLEYFTLFRD